MLYYNSYYLIVFLQTKMEKKDKIFIMIFCIVAVNVKEKRAVKDP